MFGFFAPHHQQDLELSQAVGESNTLTTFDARRRRDFDFWSELSILDTRHLD